MLLCLIISTRPSQLENGQLFIDDLYVFSDSGSTVFIMDVNSNITGCAHQTRFPS